MKKLWRAVMYCLLLGLLQNTGLAQSVSKQSSAEKVEREHLESIVGTWILKSYRVWDENGQVQEPFGKTPSGFAVFDAKGKVFIQLLREHDATKSHSDQEREEIAKSYGGYFGTYEIDSKRSTLTFKVLGSNLPSYIGSTQVRQFSITGSTLSIGQAGKYQAIVERL